jgi:ABC-type branched-subunit amino acid transport system substrate-binding protein
VTPSNRRAWRSGILVAAALVLLSVVAVDTPGDGPQEVATSGSGASDTGPAAGEASTADPVAGDAAAAATAGQSGTGGPAAAGPGGRAGAATGGQGARAGAAACKPGANGGATDVGVTGDRIKLAATNVRSGVGSSFLGSAYVGMQAVINRVNARGGVCGRLLELRLVDDGWDAARGAGFLQNFIKEQYFALPVVPSSEGLTQAITSGTISSSGIPVIGTDGMLKEQYADPWVWPVATATVSTMRIMAKHGFDSGARTFGIVYDERYKFGREGAEAFKQYVESLPGAQLKAYVGITPGQNSYSGEANAFNEKCAGGCDFVAMLLDPTTANVYISSHTEKDGKKQGFGKILTGGAQPLFNERFARQCGAPCEGMLVWTGYNPPIGGLSSQKDVAAYINDVKSVDPGVDITNQFLEGSYLGMQVFVHALEKVGPNLTRAALRDVMNSLTYQSTIASSLAWAPKQRFANQGAQAFRIVTSSKQFTGFAEVGTGFIKDPQPGVVPK